MHQKRKFVVVMAAAALFLGLPLSVAVLDDVQAKSAQPNARETAAP
jgi:hypothetical protein